MNSRNSNRESYNNFILSSHQSLHSLISLVRQQDDNFYNLLTQPSYTRGYSINTPQPNLNPRFRRNTYTRFGSHRSGNISYPSHYTSNNNLVFERVLSGATPRSANLENNNQVSAIDILRATECCIFSTIQNPINNYCPISQEEFTANQEVIMIKHCGHLFKQEPLLTWFSNHSTCPYCRYDIKEYSLQNNLSQDEEEEDQEEDLEEDETTEDEIDISHNIINSNERLASDLGHTISELLEDNLRQQISSGTNHEFQYTIYGQRL
jgi:hypothetical protein